MKKILITGFTPFGTFKNNPAGDVLELLPKQYNDYMILTSLLPVSIHSTDIIIDNIKYYDVILNLGLASGRKTYTIENQAMNIDNFSIPDNDGNQIINSKIKEDGDAFYISTLPIDKISNLDNMEISYSAGTFICNHTMYIIGYVINKNKYSTKFGFLHIPDYVSLNDIKDKILEVIELL